jgi:hypothetical protein
MNVPVRPPLPQVDINFDEIILGVHEAHERGESGEHYFDARNFLEEQYDERPSGVFNHTVDEGFNELVSKGMLADIFRHRDGHRTEMKFMVWSLEDNHRYWEFEIHLQHLNDDLFQFATADTQQIFQLITPGEYRISYRQGMPYPIP